MYLVGCGHVSFSLAVMRMYCKDTFSFLISFVFPSIIYFVTVDIFRGLDMSLLLWSQIRSWLEGTWPEENCF